MEDLGKARNEDSQPRGQADTALPAVRCHPEGRRSRRAAIAARKRRYLSCAV
jgi:hypothetical protein